MRVEGYLEWVTPLWAWEDEVAERLIAFQEYWIDRDYLVVTRNEELHYGVILNDWQKFELSRLITFSRG